MATKNEISLSKAELDSLIKEAEHIVASTLREETAKLSKAAEESSPSDPAKSPSTSPSTSASPSVEGSSPSPSSPSPAPDAATPAEPPASPEGAPPAPGDSQMQAEEPAPGAQGPTDPAALKAEYSKLPDTELEAHYMAAKEAIYERLQTKGAGPSSPMTPSAPSGMSAVSPPSPGPSGSTPAFKSEPSATAEVMKKTEAKITELENGLGKAFKIIEMLTVPMRKSLTGLEYTSKPGSDGLKKSEKMSKAEISKALTAKITDPKLSKHDRELISQWCYGAAQNTEIEHLLQ